MNLERELHRLVDDSLSDDPRIALVACRKLAIDHLAWLTDRAVLSARRANWSWTVVGKLCGLTRQAARQRFSRLDTVQPPPPSPTSPQWGSDRDKRYFERRRHERLAAELQHWEITGVGIVAW